MRLPLAIALAGLLVFPLCQAEQRPLWEVGAGGAALSLPDYRGSDQTGSYLLPIPYFVYRGEFLKADRGGMRGTLFQTDKLEINLSLNATLPVNSKDNRARRGMADLRPTVELGPTVDVNLWRSGNQKMKLDFRAPLRTAITLESSPRQVGWLFSPSLDLDVKNVEGWPGWNFGVVAGPIFTSRKYNAHFYSVSAADATATRPVFRAGSGYAGSQITLGVSKRFPRYWVGGFLRYDTVAGATFRDSPLVRDNHSISAGIALSWVFGESSTLVSVDE